MEDEEQRRNQFRVYFVDRKAQVLSGFAHKYISYLLPGLTKAMCFATTCAGTQDKTLQKLVRFEVDMGLVISAYGFKWSHALKQSLINQSYKIHKSPTLYVTSKLGISFASENVSNNNNYGHFDPPKVVPKFLAEPKAGKSGRMSSMSCTNKMDDVEELEQLMTSLRRILPGGNEIISSDVSEIITEVESYVVCLQLQVNILKSLVEAC